MAEQQHDPRSLIEVLRLLRRYSTNLACLIAVVHARETFQLADVLVRYCLLQCRDIQVLLQLG